MDYCHKMMSNQGDHQVRYHDPSSKTCKNRLKPTTNKQEIHKLSTHRQRQDHFFTFIVCYMKLSEMIHDEIKVLRKGEKKQLFKPFKQKDSLKLSF